MSGYTSGSTTSELPTALGLLAALSWPVQEASYGLLLRLLQNALDNPGEPKFRSVKRTSAALKSKLLDCPGGTEALIAAGFREESDAFVLAEDIPTDTLRTSLQIVQSHAEAKRLEHLRAERDAKIAKAKAEEAELAKFGGFARGIHNLGSKSASTAHPKGLPTPVLDAYVLKDDPRKPGEAVGVIAFYFPGYNEPWDQKCQAGFLGNFFLQPKGEEICIAPPSFPEREHSFTNAEAAFQALKLWKYADEFEHADGSSAFALKNKLYSEADMTYSGFGSNWNAMLGVLRQKFRVGTACAAALLATGDTFLLEHNAVAGRDKIWSDNKLGDGTNWLGLQLMVLRDDLRANGDSGTWTNYLRSLLDLESGRPQDASCTVKWQETVQAAASAVNA
eukprot:TRINITY_DN94753_c0_g1_i1.p1 TRINITY_DN94753_c0_g1~~TRINITY_DN94753_c0_g1_i1.p1  ORF type:complete len:392 (+),score=87.08 TRINITY_DN94753_c0_g1_i1:117-1292(+)